MNEEPEINITPLIDVVFVILIMFIVVAPLLDIDRIDLAVRGEGSLPVRDKSVLQIFVKKDNRVFVNDEEVSLPFLAEKLKMELLKHPEVTPQLFHDKEAYFGTYQEVKNSLEFAGFSQLDVVLAP